MRRLGPRSHSPSGAPASVLAVALALLLLASVVAETTSFAISPPPTVGRSTGIYPGLLSGPRIEPNKASPCPPTCALVVTETGLPSGTNWSATVTDGPPVTEYSRTSSIVFNNETNGTYTFSIGAVSGYTANPSSGSVVINGSSVYVPIAFQPSSVLFGLGTTELEALSAGIAIGIVIGVVITWTVLRRAKATAPSSGSGSTGPNP